MGNYWLESGPLVVIQVVFFYRLPQGIIRHFFYLPGLTYSMNFHCHYEVEALMPDNIGLAAVIARSRGYNHRIRPTGIVSLHELLPGCALREVVV